MTDKTRKLAVPKKSNFEIEEATGIPIETVSTPYPLNRRVPLSQHSPEIAAQWLYEKNCGLTPDDFSYGSGINAWWRCDQGPDHIWRQRICVRASIGSGCPYCDSKKVSVTSSLAALYPELAKSWHPTKNQAKATEVTAYNTSLAWWICPKEHEWISAIQDRTYDATGCPICNEERFVGLRDFPEYLKYFDYAKNKGLDPLKVVIGKPIWWRCDEAPDHRWKAAFWKTHAEEPCPFCRGKKASSTNNLTLDKDLIKDFDPKLNPGLKPENLTLGSHKIVTWKCQKCAHVWKLMVSQRTKNDRGCRNCAGTVKRKQTNK